MLPLVVIAFSSISSFARAAPMALSYDDVIVLKADGKSEIIKAADFDQKQARAGDSSVARTNSLNPSNIAPRGCDKSKEVQVLSDTEFLNWDVAISPVVSSLGGETASVAVTDGYMIANSLTVTEGVNCTPVKDILQLTYSISYAETWTTQQSQTLTFTVPDNMYGVIVSQPYVHRIQGNVLSGCTDNPSNTTFMSDTYTSQSYGDLNWVKGVIRLCSSETYPIPYCIGDGNHS